MTRVSADLAAAQTAAQRQESVVDHDVYFLIGMASGIPEAVSQLLLGECFARSRWRNKRIHEVMKVKGDGLLEGIEARHGLRGSARERCALACVLAPAQE